jgi:hypothetical protein
VRNVKGLVPEIALRFLAYNRPQAARIGRTERSGHGLGIWGYHDQHERLRGRFRQDERHGASL